MLVRGQAFRACSFGRMDVRARCQRAVNILSVLWTTFCSTLFPKSIASNPPAFSQSSNAVERAFMRRETATARVIHTIKTVTLMDF